MDKTTKKCSSCKEEKDLNQFNKNKRRSDGLNTLCKYCSRKRSRKYYADNREKHIKYVYTKKKERRFKIAGK